MIGFAYRPLIDPIDVLIPWVHDAWFLLLLPLAFGISLVYRAVRLEDLSRLWVSTLQMTAQVVFGMVALAVAGYLFVVVLVPWLTPAAW